VQFRGVDYTPYTTTVLPGSDIRPYFRFYPYCNAFVNVEETFIETGP
jgi:hypothetical protein